MPTRPYHGFHLARPGARGQGPRARGCRLATDAATARCATDERYAPGFDVSVWHGIVGPAGMDPRWWRASMPYSNQVLQVPAVRTAITEGQAADIVGGTPQQFDAFIKGELKRWPEVVRAAGIKPE